MKEFAFYRQSQLSVLQREGRSSASLDQCSWDDLAYEREIHQCQRGCRRCKAESQYEDCRIEKGQEDEQAEDKEPTRSTAGVWSETHLIGSDFTHKILELSSERGRVLSTNRLRWARSGTGCKWRVVDMDEACERLCCKWSFGSRGSSSWMPRSAGAEPEAGS
ncbi:uncharacterized protein PGTG_02602 [Puccinia graminis f. sp. tritici CRL 75-36-700-3]|uniref:Uncharacterized protein n=1 Tax=Puccinia graminis f. sp. tritici (strain CRL 75-36-700-3 / race SCCL) TaxID=418459 RepID=E3JVT6_PUCGT|nr:uncharacterized protein PGTG_02602 [Puccinia graminis f. sp. tritici CRL 75-36-700-3]EFP76161.1 hypothetical protein PGTG_02602 [Puccinia graminis f. sp. tritici CRL 75-36-700-3]